MTALSTLVPPLLLIDFLDTLPPIVLGILIIIAIIFVVKSLIKFAIIVAAIALIVFVAWQLGWLSF